jgi:carboxyl-terminal processing protease
VDEHTTGAGERIAAFAQENGLAPIVGSRTAGRLICSSAYKVGQGYFVRVPARAWYTWGGENLESKGVVPEHEVPAGNGTGSDVQLERAREVVRSL